MERQKEGNQADKNVTIDPALDLGFFSQERGATTVESHFLFVE